jgi:hypothetical protein
VETKIKRRIAIGAAGLTLVGGGGGAYALSEGSGDNERKAFIEDAAKRLDVSPEELRSALRGAFFDRLDADVKKGRLSQQQADQIKRQVRRNGDAGPPGPGRIRMHGPHPGGPFMAPLRAAAKYLGLSNAELRKQLRSGKSLADVAKARDKSVDGLKEAIKKAAADELDSRIDDLVNRSGPPGPPAGGRFRMERAPGPPPPGF